MVVVGIVDSKVTDIWNVWDALSMLQQLGHIPEASLPAIVRPGGVTMDHRDVARHHRPHMSSTHLCRSLAATPSRPSRVLSTPIAKCTVSGG